MKRNILVAVRKHLQWLKNHNSVLYDGPLYVGSGYLGLDITFKDSYYQDYDCPTAYIKNSETRRRMEKIIKVLEPHCKQQRFEIGKYWFRILH